MEHQKERKNNGKNRNTDGEKLDHPHIAVGNVKWDSLSGKLAVSYETKHAITIKLYNCTLGIHDREVKIYIYTKTSTWMFIAAFLLIPKTGEKKTKLMSFNG